MEHTLIPYRTGPLPTDSDILVLAPHPDDEIFGCGGALALHADAGAQLHVVLVTGGDAAGEAAARLEESHAAARALGIPEPDCWGIPDRHVSNAPGLVKRIREAITATGATLIYAPSLWENHPDHRALAEATLQVVRELGHIGWMAYEVSAPLRPNLLIDISPVLDRKHAAMACFPSQLAVQAYDRHLKALNIFRTYTLPAAVTAAEAYEYYPPNTLSDGGPTLLEQEINRLTGTQPPRPKASDENTLQAEVDTLRRQRAALLNSTSWRITAPLRTMGYLLKRLGRKR